MKLPRKSRTRGMQCFDWESKPYLPVAVRRRDGRRCSATAAASSTYFVRKRWLERLLAAALLVVALPLLTLIAVAVVVTSGRPIFYRQTRVGMHGRLFTMWKFRTMRCDAEERSGAVWSVHNDTRVTSVGRVLRLSHLDELPQLFNVIAGHMNLIGPRPERPEFVPHLAEEIPTYTRRMLIPPGITGLAQVQRGYDTCVDDVWHKLSLDLLYIKTANWRLDLWILWRTVPQVVRFGQWSARSGYTMQDSSCAGTEMIVGLPAPSKRRRSERQNHVA